MKKQSFRSMIATASLVLGVVTGITLPVHPAVAQVANGFHVTNPAMLKSMGFPPDAANVYMDNLVGKKIVFDEQDTLIPLSTPTTGTDYSAISAKEFSGRIDTTGTQWRYTGGPNCCVDLSRVGTELFADAQFEVPTGATLNFFRSWAFDNNPSNLAFFVFEVCQPGFAGGAPVFTTLVSTATSGTPGHTSNLVGLNRLVNNRDCTYLARVRFDAASPTLALQKVRLQFTR